MSSGTGVVPAPARSRHTAPAVGHSRRSSSGRLGRATSGTPWGSRDLLNLLVWQLAGLAGIGVTYWICSGETKFHDQVVMIAFSLLAVTVAAVGAAIFLITGLAEVGRERLAVRQAIGVRYGLTPAAARDKAHGAEFVTAEGMRRYHLADCDVVIGKQTRRLADGEAEKLQPCGMCQS